MFVFHLGRARVSADLSANWFGWSPRGMVDWLREGGIFPSVMAWGSRKGCDAGVAVFLGPIMLRVETPLAPAAIMRPMARVMLDQFRDYDPLDDDCDPFDSGDDGQAG